MTKAQGGKSRRAIGRIKYSFERAIDAISVQRLLKQTTWARERSLEGIQKMLDETPVKLGAWSGEDLIAFARALSDGMYKAYIDDVVVDEPYRKRGIGAQLIQRMLEKLKGVKVVFLTCCEKVVAFYLNNARDSGLSIGDRKLWSHVFALSVFIEVSCKKCFARSTNAKAQTNLRRAAEATA